MAPTESDSTVALNSTGSSGWLRGMNRESCLGALAGWLQQGTTAERRAWWPDTVTHSPVDDRIAIQTSEPRPTDGPYPERRCAIELVAGLEAIPEQRLYVAPDDLCVSLRDWSPDGKFLLVSLWWPQGIGPGYEPLEEPPVDNTHYLLDVSTGALRGIAVGDAFQPVSWRPEP